MPDYCPGDIEVSPLERIRYNENRKFSAIVTADLAWLVTHRHTADAQSVRRKATDLCEQLTPSQRALFERVTQNIEAACLSDGRETPETIAQTFQRMRQLEPTFPYVEAEDVQVTRFGTCELTVSPVEWYRLGRKDLGYVMRELPKNDRLQLDDRERGIILNTVFVKGSQEGEADEAELRSREEVLCHETFHLLNHRYIETETVPRYQDPVERDVFMMAKNEMIAYLFQGRWAYRLKDLFNSTWNKYVDPRGDKHALDIQQDGGREVIRRIEESLAENRPDDSHNEDEALDFYLEFYFVQRELARLSALRDPSIKEGIVAILGAQSFKEMGYNLSKIGPRDLSVENLFPEGADVRTVDPDLLMEISNFTKQLYEYKISGLEEYARKLQSEVPEAYMMTGPYVGGVGVRLNRIESALEGILRRDA